MINKCPFCGSNKVEISSLPRNSLYDFSKQTKEILKNYKYQHHSQYRIICHKCFATGPKITAFALSNVCDFRGEIFYLYKKKILSETEFQKIVIDLWNTRVKCNEEVK